MGKKKSTYNKGDKILLEYIKLTNSARLRDYYTCLALNRFRWEGLPDTIESRHIEMALFQNGQAFFYEHETIGLVCLPCYSCSELNIYGDPLAVNVTGYNNTSTIKQIDEGVRIMDNDKATPPLYHIEHYVNVLNEAEQTLLMNLEQQRFPYIIPTTPETELTLKNMMNQVSNYQTGVYVDKKLSEDLQSGEGIKVLKTEAPYLLDKLEDFKGDIQNELYSFLGLNNANTDKKERMLNAEVNVNNSQILMSLDLAYKNRLLACEKINKKYGLNVRVVKVIDELQTDFIGQQKEGGSDE